MSRVVTAGFLVLDAVLHQRGVTHTAGGTAGNIAGNLAALGWEAAVCGLLGNDAGGRHIVADLAASGVDVNDIELRADVETPVVLHSVNDHGHEYRFECPACGRKSAKARPMRSERVGEVTDRLGHFDVFCFDRCSAAALALAAHCSASGGLVVFEPSSAGRVSLLGRALDVAHIVKWAGDRLGQLPAVIGEARDGQLQVSTSGGEGLKWRLGDEPWTSADAYPVAVLDAAGAGDWVTAGLVSGVAPDSIGDRSAIAAALDYGQAMAALSCRAVGAAGLRRGLNYGPPSAAANGLRLCRTCLR